MATVMLGLIIWGKYIFKKSIKNKHLLHLKINITKIIYTFEKFAITNGPSQNILLKQMNEHIIRNPSR